MESQQKKFNLEKREYENLRKKQKEQFDKYKEDETKKIGDNKKIVEQRQRNVSLANQSSKRDREEIDNLRKQLVQVKDDMSQKEKYQKSQIERLSRQCSDLRQENQELRDEIAHYDQSLRDTRENQFNKDFNNNQKQNSRQTGIGGGLMNKKTEPKAQDGRNSSRQQLQSYVEQAKKPQVKDKRQLFAKTSTLVEFENNEEQVQEMINNHEDAQDDVRGIEEVKQQQHPHQDAEDDDYEMKMPHLYHNDNQDNTTVQEDVQGNDGKIQRTYLNGKKEVIFSNGVRRETFPDGYTIVCFNN